MNRRLVAGAAVAATISPLTTGCGGKSAAPSGIAGAVRATKAAKTARYSLVYSEAGEAPSRGTGAIEFGSYRGTAALGSGTHAYRSVWDISGVYVRSSTITIFRHTRKGDEAVDTTTRPWVFIPTDEGVTFIGALKLLDLTRIVDLLARGTFRNAGRSKVDGRPVEHWQGSIAFADFVKVFLPPSTGKPLLKVSHAPVPVEAWVDSTGLLRRVAYSVPRLKTDSRPARATFDLHDLGKPVQIGLPGAEDVMNVDYLLDTTNGK